MEDPFQLSIGVVKMQLLFNRVLLYPPTSHSYLSSYPYKNITCVSHSLSLFIKTIDQQECKVGGNIISIQKIEVYVSYFDQSYCCWILCLQLSRVFQVSRSRKSSVGGGPPCDKSQWGVPNLLSYLLRHLLMHTLMNTLTRYKSCAPNSYFVL